MTETGSYCQACEQCLCQCGCCSVLNFITTGLTGFGLCLAPIASFLTVSSQSGSFQMLLTEFARKSVAVWILCVLRASSYRMQAVVVGLNCDHWITGGGWICWLGFLPCSRQSEERHNDAGRDFHATSELLPSSEHPSASSCFLTIHHRHSFFLSHTHLRTLLHGG